MESLLWAVMNAGTAAWAAPMYVVYACVVVLLAYGHWATRKTVNTPGPYEFPYIQSLPYVWTYGYYGILDGILKGAHEIGWQTLTLKFPFSPRYTLVFDPACVEHVLKTRFDNYVKGPVLCEILRDLLGQGIFASDGELWHTQRKVAVQLFSYRNFRDNIMRVFKHHGAAVVDILRKHADSGEPVDIHSLFHRFTLDAIAEIAFGTPIDSLHDPGHVFARSFDAAQQIIDKRIYTPAWQVLKYVLPREYVLRRAIAVMDSYCAGMIRERRERADFEERPDVLSRFMALRDETTQERLYLNDDKYLRDVIMNFMIAGRDTTAQALSWCTWCIMQHRAVEAGIVAEARSVASQAAPTTSGTSTTVDFDPTYDDVLHRLKYTLAVLQETLRLYPSVPKDTKMAIADDTLPDGSFVPAGTFVAYLPHAMARNTAVWGSDATEFKPERFLGNEKFSQFKYISFNAGPRTCLGKHMALVEASYLIALIHSHFSFEMVPGHIVRPADSLTLPMQYGLRVVVRHRA